MPDTIRKQREFALQRLTTARSGGSATEVSRAEQLVVIAHLAFADALAMRYRGRGIESEDLIQIARLALMQSVGRWDPNTGDFLGFATPTITGSIKRHFRDHLYLVRIPRELYEVNREADLASSEFREENPSRPPTVQEVAIRIGRSESELRRARLARLTTQYLDIDVARFVPSESPYNMVENRQDLQMALRRLDGVERRLLYRYYFLSWSQARIAGQMGVSQMQVSRVHAQIIRKLRRMLTP